jgi:hypothetical protein
MSNRPQGDSPQLTAEQASQLMAGAQSLTDKVAALGDQLAATKQGLEARFDELGEFCRQLFGDLNRELSEAERRWAAGRVGDEIDPAALSHRAGGAHRVDPTAIGARPVPGGELS